MMKSSLNRYASSKHSLNKCSGFTLLEVLIATVILAVGLLGISGLQVTGMRSNHSALLRSQATLLAYDMSDRMRANTTAVSASDYNEPAATADAACSTTAGCTPAAMAKNDMSVWGANITNSLPTSAGVVCLDSTPDDGADSATPACDGIGTGYAIKIWWQDSRVSTAPLNRFVVTHLQ